MHNNNYILSLRFKKGYHKNEKYRLILNERFMMIKWKSGKTYFLDLLTGDNVPEEYRKILLTQAKKYEKKKFTPLS